MPFIDPCPGCPYQRKAIGPRGNPASVIVLVGEAPGATEVDEGQPFVGRAGTEVLWPAVAQAGLSEAEVYVVNAVACRPFNPATPRSRRPSPTAIVACHERLGRDLDHPRAVLVALGATAIEALTGRRSFPVTAPFSATLPSPWGPVVPTLHPAYVLRRGLAGRERERLVEDLRRARRLALVPDDASPDGAEDV